MATTAPTEPVPITAAALKLGLGYWRLRDAILRGEITGFKIAGKWHVSADSLERFAHTTRKE